MKPRFLILFFSLFMLLTITTSGYTAASVPSDGIDFDFSYLETESQSPYSVKVRYYSPYVSYCFFRVTDSTRQNYLTLMMRLDASHNKLWVATFVEQSVGGLRYTDSIFLTGYDNTTVTKLYDQNNNFIGVEVDWIFSLCKDVGSPFADGDGDWAPADNSIYFGGYVIGDGEAGYTDSAQPVSYYDGLAPIESEIDWVNNRALYVWDQTPVIVNDMSQRNDFYSFITAPHSLVDAEIFTVFMNFDSMNITGADKEAVKEFIADLHSRGIEIHYLSGDPSWAQPAYQSYAVSKLNAVLQYNSEVSEEERFDGIQFDIEPHALSGWPSDAVWQDFIDSVSLYQDMVDAHNNSTGDDIVFGSVLTYWYDEYYLSSKPINEYIQDIVDYVVVMNYRTNTGASDMTLCADEIDYCQNLNNGKYVYISLETMNLGGDDPYSYVSFWNLGNSALETMIDDLEALYSSNDCLSGTAIHYYEAPDGEGYRNLRADELSLPGTDYNSAPVCTVVSPGGGNVEVSDLLEISYTVYDADTDNLEVEVYVVDGANEIYIGYESLRVNDFSRSASSVLSIDPLNFSLSEGVSYKVKMIVTESGEGLNCFDISDSWFTFSLVSVEPPAPVYFAMMDDVIAKAQVLPVSRINIRNTILYYLNRADGYLNQIPSDFTNAVKDLNRALNYIGKRARYITDSAAKAELEDMIKDLKEVLQNQ